jgi:HK97 family phage major capsid protein
MPIAIAPEIDAMTVAATASVNNARDSKMGHWTIAFRAGSRTDQPCRSFSTRERKGDEPVEHLYAAEQALGARFRPNAHWFANKVVYNDILQDANTASSIWNPSNRPEDQRGNLGYDLITYPANEVSAMTSTITGTDNKVACIGDPSYFVIVDRIWS